MQENGPYSMIKGFLSVPTACACACACAGAGVQGNSDHNSKSNSTNNSDSGDPHTADAGRVHVDGHSCAHGDGCDGNVWVWKRGMKRRQACILFYHRIHYLSVQQSIATIHRLNLVFSLKKTSLPRPGCSGQMRPSTRDWRMGRRTGRVWRRGWLCLGGGDRSRPRTGGSRHTCTIASEVHSYYDNGKSKNAPKWKY